MASASQLKVQKYMEQQNIQPLLEDLMSHLIKDQPQEPIVYLMKVLQRKAESSGIHVPLQVKIDMGSNRIRSMSPKKKETEARISGDASRGYTRPWMSQTAPFHRSRQRLVSGSGDRKQKIGTSSGDLDDIWNQTNRRSTTDLKKEKTTSSLKYSSSLNRIQPVSINYSGPGNFIYDDEDPLAQELPVVPDDQDDYRGDDQLQSCSSSSQRGKRAAYKTEHLRKAREEKVLEQLNIEKERMRNANMTEFKDPRLEDKENSQVFILEDNETLMAEGVNVDKRARHSGLSPMYTISSATFQTRETLPSAQVKVSICQNCAKIFTANRPLHADVVDDILSDVSKSDTVKNTGQPHSSRSIGSDIESASQVDGPRPLKWTHSESSSKSRTHSGLPPNAVRDKTSQSIKSHTKRSSPIMKGRGWDIPASPKSFLDDDDEIDLEISARTIQSKDDRKY